MVDRADCRVSGTFGIDAVCVSRCALDASASLFPCCRDAAQWNGPYAFHGARANRVFGTISAPGARILLLASSANYVDLFVCAVARYAQGRVRIIIISRRAFLTAFEGIPVLGLHCRCDAAPERDGVHGRTLSE